MHTGFLEALDDLPIVILIEECANSRSNYGAHIGNAEYYPMARAISGGLASSTLLTLLVMPTYYRLATVWATNLRGGWRSWRGQGERGVVDETAGAGLAGGS